MQLSTWTQARREVAVLLSLLRHAALAVPPATSVPPLMTGPSLDSITNLNLNSYQLAGMDWGTEKIPVVTRQHISRMGRHGKSLPVFLAIDHDLFVRTGQSVFKPLCRTESGRFPNGSKIDVIATGRLPRQSPPEHVVIIESDFAEAEARAAACAAVIGVTRPPE